MTTEAPLAVWFLTELPDTSPFGTVTSMYSLLLQVLTQTQSLVTLYAKKPESLILSLYSVCI